VTGRPGPAVPVSGSGERVLVNAVPLHPLLAARWSPVTFDAAYEVPAAEVESLLEAARWAPSAGNSQPWSFVTGRRGDTVHTRLVAHLAGSSARWAPTASLLVANLCHRRVEDTDWDYSEFALYDLGQAVAHMTVQAQSLGLAARQFRAFDRAGLEAELGVPPHWEVTTLTAFGRPPVGAPADPARPRRSREDLTWPTP
jgi:nitroreductase